ncbi:MAG: hypothetical protein ACREJC_15700 [Tepidisphaeraceae bacterium]
MPAQLRAYETARRRCRVVAFAHSALLIAPLLDFRLLGDFESLALWLTGVTVFFAAPMGALMFLVSRFLEQQRFAAVVAAEVLCYFEMIVVVLLLLVISPFLQPPVLTLVLLVLWGCAISWVLAALARIPVSNPFHDDARGFEPIVDRADHSIDSERLK